MNNIRQTTKYVVEESEHVALNKGALQKYAEHIQPTTLKPWFADAPLDIESLDEKEKVHFLLLFGALSFSYWGEPKWLVSYDTISSGGSWGLILAFKRALDEGLSIFDMEYLATLEEEDIAHILRGSAEMPMFEDRVAVIHEVSTTLTEKYAGDFRLFLKQSDDVNTLRGLFTTQFPAFKDTSEYNGKTIYFDKRAQIVLSGIQALLPKATYTQYINGEEFTALTDYRIPQILRILGILEYTPVLATKIDSFIELPRGSAEETEIRANTLWAIEHLKEEVNTKHGTSLSAMQINDFLWLETQRKGFNKKIHHRVRTTSY